MISSHFVKAQDLIVTNKGDSINCRITQKSQEYIYYAFKYNNEVRNTLIPFEQVKYYKKNFYGYSDVPLDSLKNAPGNYSRWRIGINGGWSYMPVKTASNIPPDFNQYYKNLKSGYHFGGDVTFFFAENIGVGFSYSSFITKEELNNIYATNIVTVITRTGKLKDDITIQYYGPTLCSRVSSKNKKSNFISCLSIGYVTYNNNATLIDNFIIKGNTIGLMGNVGVDFALDNNFALGITAAYTVGSLSEYTKDDGNSIRSFKLEQNKYESINHLDLSVALKWYR